MTDTYTEKKVVVNSKFDLAATLSIPAKRDEKMPAVILISGTGKADRDGNMPKFPMRIYKDLSDYFANQGFVTIRYDKRGVGKSNGEHLKTGFNDLVDDVLANINFLEGLEYVDADRIILCGHSEGTMIATIASTKHKVGGIVLIAGAGISMRTALEYQNWLVLQESKILPGLKGWIYRKAINEKNYLKNVNKIFDLCNRTDKDIVRFMFQKIPAKWFREHNRLKDEAIIQILSNSDCPVLAITGDKDVQANSDDIKRISAMKFSNVTCRIVSDMDHILRKYKGEKSVLNIKKQYTKEFSQPIHETLLNEIGEWTVRSGLN